MHNLCEQLHNILRKGKRFDFISGFNGLPEKGIYVLYEKNEIGHGGDRIVRIGTHGTNKENNEFISRLKQHFIKENKNRSIFRKHIGRAMLNKANDDYLEKWNLDTTSKADKIKNTPLIDKDREEEIERQVSTYIQSNFYFVILEVNTSKERDYFESRLIGTVSNCKICKASNKWLGNYSPRTNSGKKIIGSGLWNVDKLYSPSLTEEELKTIEKCLVH
jgi:hypothetical protein